MARTRKHLRLIDIAKRNHGLIALDNADVQNVLANGTAYRLPSYIWDIKHYAQLEVVAIRQGRKIIGYALPAIQALTAAEAAVETVEPSVECAAPSPNLPEAVSAV